MTSLVATILGLALAMAPGVPVMAVQPAPPPVDASKIVERAEAAYMAEKWSEAAEAVGEAYALDPNPLYLYAQAQASRQAGQCEEALVLYDRFLATDPPAEAAQEAKINRARCEASVEDAPPPVAPDPDPAQGPGHGSDAMRPWYRDPVGGSLLGIGVVSTAIGAGLWGIALSNDGDAVASATEDEFISSKDEARTRYTVGVALVSVGAALMIAGAIRWGLVARKSKRASQRAAVSPMGLTVRF